jgi:hypothetical protein
VEVPYWGRAPTSIAYAAAPYAYAAAPVDYANAPCGLHCKSLVLAFHLNVPYVVHNVH